MNQQHVILNHSTGQVYWQGLSGMKSKLLDKTETTIAIHNATNAGIVNTASGPAYSCVPAHIEVWEYETRGNRNNTSEFLLLTKKLLRWNTRVKKT